MTEATGVNRTVLRRTALLVVSVLFFLYAFLLCLRPLADPDLWWHLKTGQWIVENRALPGEGNEDPFSYTSPRPLSEGEVKGLRSQWLGQVAFYLVYRAGGYAGLSTFSALLIVLPFLFIYAWALRRGAGPLRLLPLAFPPLFIAAELFYTFERPQAFSFSLALVAYLLLRRLREGRTSGWLLPPVMALWSNLHGGYFAGVAIIGVFATGEAIGLAARKAGVRPLRGEARSPLRFFGVCALSIAASGLNPGGYRILMGGWGGGLLRALGEAGPGQAGSLVLFEVLEYKPLWYFYTEFHYIWPVYLGLFFMVAPVQLVLKYASEKRVDLAEAMVCAAIAFFGVYYARGINFALVVLSFMACAGGEGLAGLRRAAAPALAGLVALMLLADQAVSAPWKLKPGVPESWVDASYPEGAVQFIEEHDIGGRMFNDMRWGGYLAWRLYPRHRVFIDGRTVSGGVTGLYLAVIKGTPAAGGVLDTFDVNFLVLPVMSTENGVISPLILVLTKEAPPRWKLVYLWGNTAVFVRDSSRNTGVIACCSLPMGEIYREVLEVSDFILSIRPGHPEALLSRAIALYELKMYREAKQALLALPEKTAVSEDLLRRLEGY